MKRTALALILFAVVGQAQAAPSPLPRDVKDFVSRRESCDHWRGEPSYDDERKSEIAWASCQSCQGTDASLAGLKRKYRTNAKVMKELGEFEPKIEPDDRATAREFCRRTRKPEWQK